MTAASWLSLPPIGGLAHVMKSEGKLTMTLHTDKAKTMVLDTLEAIPIGGVTQWIRIRSHDQANPVLPVDPARPRPAHDQRGPDLRTSPSSRRALHDPRSGRGARTDRRSTRRPLNGTPPCWPR
jgi:hypothetical protein